MKPHLFQRVRLASHARPDAANRVAATFQLCGHYHATREDAESCPSGGDLIYNFTANVLEVPAAPREPLR